ncbi:MAG: hypothetical protein JWM58_2908 [Rhizobium sp.]|nr:hypothetical protein [Rhizobium sp.]
MVSDQPMNWLDDDQISSTRPRYAVRGEEDGTWSVYDTKTDLPAVLDEWMMVQLVFEVADDMVEMLNNMDADANGQRSS